jgi:hypothetical protein
MRAVSFFGPDATVSAAGPRGGAVIGLGIGGGEGTPPDAKSLPARGPGGGRDKGGGSTRFAGGGGSGVCASGGRGGVDAGPLGGWGGGRVGKLIRTVSGSGAGVAGGWPAPGGRVMRTVSFLGSFGSAIRACKPV